MFQTYKIEARFFWVKIEQHFDVPFVDFRRNQKKKK